jgi:hypothetical protein
MTDVQEHKHEDEDEILSEPKTPYDLLAERYPSAPNKSQIESYKTQVPGHRIRLFELPDGRRAVILRAIAPLELAGIQAEASKFDVAKQLFELQVAVASKCTIWCSFTSSGKLTDSDIRNSGAGLAVTLHAVVWDLSDYIDPAAIDTLSIDL